MTERIYLDRAWRFREVFSEEYINNLCEDGEEVSLPHTVKVLPYDYFDESAYQTISCYQRVITYQKAWEGKRILLTFEGAAHRAYVYLNGELLCDHKCGYTAFSIDISGKLKEGSNLVTVKLDSRESLDQPPFGYVIDYMTYGGLYRDVYLTLTEPESFNDIFLRPSLDSAGRGILKADASFSDQALKAISEGRSELEIDLDGRMVFRGKIDKAALKKGENLSKYLEELRTEDHFSFEIKDLDVNKWDIESPCLYKTDLILLTDGKISDARSFKAGFRNIEWKSDGFYLNGRKVKIRGLNRHQSYPYVGYAMPESMQREDARILKEELGVNTVRTSHYPQSQYFIDECDRLGLLVFTEIPGWQHIGEGAWKDQAVQNVCDMVRQYRNHPSIIIWGVRINESKDDDSFYERTNIVAHVLDPSRPTGGVRASTAGRDTNIEEDVFTYNDFLHNGSNHGCLRKDKATNDMSKPYLVTEYNGHMYPTKTFDFEEHRQEHAIRHARVMSDIGLEDDIAGGIGWCMFDYNTHKDFGSGDRICYHGVMDMFRNPKTAAYVYAAEGSDKPVLEITSSMDIGEHPASNRGKCYIITNADSVKMYKNGRFLKEYFPADSEFKGLKHGPILIDDYIGSDLETIEGMKHDQAVTASDLLNSYSLNNGKMSGKMVGEALKLVMKYHMKPGDAVGLFQKYIGNWGEKSTEYEFKAIKDGKVVLDKHISPMTRRRLSVRLSSDFLLTGHTYDVIALRIKALDENGNLLPFCNEPVRIALDGPAEVIGPDLTSLRGGMGGFYIRSTDETGRIRITVQSENFPPAIFFIESKSRM